MADDTTSYGFLCGADMEPGSIRSNAITSESRFVDIASIRASDIVELDLPLPDVEEIWGIAVTLPHRASDGPQVSVTLRRGGDIVQATVLTDAASFGDRDAVVAEAYYWELPRSWREALALNRNHKV